MIIKINKEIFNLIDEAYDKIPSDFDFKKSNAVEIKIAQNMSSNSYRNDITLQVRVVGLEYYKGAVITNADELDKLLNKKRFLNCRIVRENAWYTSYYDEDKYNIVLQYLIKQI